MTLNIPYLETHVVDHCNLNCDLCSHFSNIAPKRFVGLDWFGKQLARLLEVADSIEPLALLGGEPTLHPELVGFVHLSRTYLPRAHIEIATNGTLLASKGADFWRALAENRIWLRITYYPGTRVDARAIARLAGDYGVGCGIRDLGKDKSWYCLLNARGDSDPRLAFANCPSRVCHTLYEGRFYLCPRPAYIHFWNRTQSKPIEVARSDYVDIFGENARSVLEQYLGRIDRSEALEFCRWCPERRQPVEWTSAATRRGRAGLVRKGLAFWVRGRQGQ